MESSVALSEVSTATWKPALNKPGSTDGSGNPTQDKRLVHRQPPRQYTEPFSRLQGYDVMALELIQNADDAKAEEILFDITDSGLLVCNSGQFTYYGNLDIRHSSLSGMMHQRSRQQFDERNADRKQVNVDAIQHATNAASNAIP